LQAVGRELNADLNRLEFSGTAQRGDAGLDGIDGKRLALLLSNQAAKFVEVFGRPDGDLNLVYGSSFERYVWINFRHFLILRSCNVRDAHLQHQEEGDPDEAPRGSIHALVPDTFNSRHTVSVSAPMSKIRFAR